jgi:hypothetical protein
VWSKNGPVRHRKKSVELTMRVIEVTPPGQEVNATPIAMPVLKSVEFTISLVQRSRQTASHVKVSQM